MEKVAIKEKKKSGCLIIGLKVLGIGFAFIIVLSILIAIFIDSGSKDDSGSKEFKYVHTAVNLRKGAGTNHDVIVMLSPGSKVEVIEKSGEWWKVRTSDVDSGYVYQSLLRPEPMPKSKSESKQQLNAEQPKGKDYSISISHSNFNENSVEYNIETNIPLPVEVMLSIDLADLKPDEFNIGTRERIILSQSPFKYSLDISNAKLPSGTYETEVTFNSNWGANNGNSEAKKIKSIVTGKDLIDLQTSYGTAEERKAKNEKQAWVMENVVMQTPWEPLKFIERLGQYEELTLINGNPKIIKVYYFKEADMTFFVNELKDNVTTWRIGKDNRL